MMPNRQFGLIGFTLSHSFSKRYFTEKFKSLNIRDASYENYSLNSIAELTSLLKSHDHLKGLNVTIPYKKEILPFLQDLTDAVKVIGACNCVKIIDGKLFGYNTDVVGFEQSLLPNLKPNHQQALILGTGGASSAVAYVLHKLGIAYRFVSRNKYENRIGYEELSEEIMHDYSLIINTTPSGMFPNIQECPTLPYDLLTNQHHLFDLIYNPEETLFLSKGRAQGATIQNGYEMLVLQAEESWRIWNA